MADKDKRYEITFDFVVKEHEGSGLKDHHSNNLAYSDVPHDGLLAIQGILKEAMDKLHELGFQHAEDRGLPTPPGHGRGRGHGRDE